MKQKTKFQNSFNPPEMLIRALIILCMAGLLNGCFLKQDRTTVVYGTVTDQNQQPVDSILVMLVGVQGFKYETLTEVYSDKSGYYEFAIEIPRKYDSGHISIPYGTKHNPKFQKNYKDFYVHKNGSATSDCCFLGVGQKTEYDFQLIPR